MAFEEYCVKFSWKNIKKWCHDIISNFFGDADSANLFNPHNNRTIFPKMSIAKTNWTSDSESP